MRLKRTRRRQTKQKQRRRRRTKQRRRHQTRRRRYKGGNTETTLDTPKTSNNPTLLPALINLGLVIPQKAINTALVVYLKFSNMFWKRVDVLLKQIPNQDTQDATTKNKNYMKIAERVIAEPKFQKAWKRTIKVISNVLLIPILIFLEVPKEIIAFVTLILALLTKALAGLAALIAMIPVIGPLIVNVLSIPFFWLVNALGYFISILAIKKGYTRQVINSRVLTLSVLVGIVIGYILGNLLPLF